MTALTALSVHPSDAAVLPADLAAGAAVAVAQILSEAASANTTRSYASALRYWAAWHLARLGQPIALPVSEAAVLQFVVDHTPRLVRGNLRWELPASVDAALVAAGVKAKPGALKLSTVTQRVAVLSSLHVLKKSPNPCEQPAVRHLLSRARRAAVKRGERPRKKTAATRTELEALLATCDDSLQGLRDRALLYFGFASGGRRRSEIAVAQWADLTQVDANTYLYRLERSKTTPAGPAADASPDKPIVGAAARALTAWLQAAGHTDGALFRRLWHRRVGEALSPEAVASIVQRRARLAGLEGDYAGHSLRSGFVTEAGRQGIALPAVMAMTEHRSAASVLGYFQTGSAASNPAARLLEDDS
jgi:integrase